MGLLKFVGDWRAARKQHAADLDAFGQMLQTFVSKTAVSIDEQQQLMQFVEQHHLKDSEVHPLQLAVYRGLFSSIVNRGTLTERERTDLLELGTFLRVPDEEKIKNAKAMAHIRLIDEINAGNLPTVHPENVIPQKGEQFYWREPAVLIENKVISREWVSGSSGFSFRIAKGVRYRVGSSRGHSVSRTADVVAATGDLFISNKRVVFAGDKKSVSKTYKQIISTQMFSDGIVFQVGTQKPFQVKYSRDVTDIIASIMTHVINSQ